MATMTGGEWGEWGVTAQVSMVAPKLHLPEDSSARKQLPIASGVIDYFPDALAYIAKISFDGNEKHNPGEPLHWARDKSNDHADCAARHFVDRGKKDAAGTRHTGQLAWRVLAMLQLELEAAKARGEEL